MAQDQEHGRERFILLGTERDSDGVPWALLASDRDGRLEFGHIEPLALGLPKRLPMPDVANHLVCSVCGARNDDLKRPIHARPDARVPGVTSKYPRW
jgi:hypothetical protein